MLSILGQSKILSFAKELKQDKGCGLDCEVDID